MNTICFISLTDLNIVPYINSYLKNISGEVIVISAEKNIDYIKPPNMTLFEFDMKKQYSNKFGKLLFYFKYAKFIKNILKKNTISSIILLHSQILLLVYSTLLKYYKNKYIIDIRDYSIESSLIARQMEKKIIKNSLAAVISSPGYKNFLPKYDYIISHNIPLIDNETREIFLKRDKKVMKVLNIFFIGVIRFFEENIRIIEKFKNDNRFRLHFIGLGAAKMLKYLKENKIENVTIVDRFHTAETLGYYSNCDIILNLYGNHKKELDYALSNKLYYAALLYMPILVSPNTYMEKVALSSGFGFSFNLEETCECDRLYKYYVNMNWNEFNKKCDNFVNHVYKENESFNCFINNLGVKK